MINLFRELLALIIFWNAVTEIRDVKLIADTNGYYPTDVHKIGKIWGFSLLEFFPFPLIFSLGLAVSALLFGLHIFTPWTTILTYVFFMSIYSRTIIVRGADDHITVILLLFLIFYDFGFQAPALFLMKALVTIIYLHAFLHKLNDKNWRDGSAIRNTILRKEWGREWAKKHLSDRKLSKKMSYFTIAAQLLIPILLWIPNLNYFGVALGIGLHFGMLITLRLGTFPILMMAILLLFLT